MLRKLNLPKAPYDIPLLYGVTVTVRPLTTHIYEHARARVTRMVGDIKRQIDEAAAAGLKLELPFDPTDRDAMAGYSQVIFVRALAQAAITAWSGPAVDGEPVNAENVSELMDVPAIAEAFVVGYSKPLADLVVEGNDYASGASGSTPGAASIAGGAANETTPVPAVNAA